MHTKNSNKLPFLLAAGAVGGDPGRRRCVAEGLRFRRYAGRLNRSQVS